MFISFDILLTTDNPLDKKLHTPPTDTPTTDTSTKCRSETTTTLPQGQNYFYAIDDAGESSKILADPAEAPPHNA